jgi:hypothetical protein
LYLSFTFIQNYHLKEINGIVRQGAPLYLVGMSDGKMRGDGSGMGWFDLWKKANLCGSIGEIE